MIDDDPDPGTDPLAGRDPHPRPQIDLWPLHDARQELLEEIVSQPGPGESPARTKILLSVVGIAAALALVAGGAWAVIGGGSDTGGNDDQVAAATSDEPAPSDEATDPTSPTSQVTSEPTKEQRRQDEVRKRGVRVGNIRTLRECLADVGRVDSGKGRVRLEELSRKGKDNWVLYVVREGRRAVAIGDDCRWMRVVPEKPRR